MISHPPVDVCQDDSVAYQRKERAPDVGAAIDAVIEAHGTLRVLLEERHAAVLARSAAVNEALEKGATMTELADKLEVSVERVRQMKQGSKGKK